MLIVANWKAYVADLAKAKALVQAAKRLAKETRVTLVLAPPLPLLGLLAARNRSSVAFAAQDISLSTGGAATGEITAQTVAAVGGTYAIVGHSERRALGETNGDVAQKIAHAQAHGLAPILCVGETERDGEGRYLSYVREQVSGGLGILSAKERSSVIVAYEPVWAIGKTAAESIPAADLTEMILYIRKVLAELLPGKSSARARILYGGSVEPSNIRALAAASGVDGFLVGHASVDRTLFQSLVREVS